MTFAKRTFIGAGVVVLHGHRRISAVDAQSAIPDRAGAPVHRRVRENAASVAASAVTRARLVHQCLRAQRPLDAGQVVIAVADGVVLQHELAGDGCVRVERRRGGAIELLRGEPADRCGCGVETIRQYLETLPPAERGWLSGLRDAVVGEALAALHREPHVSWTVDRLARVVGLSRSVLAERFTQMVGQPPMQYLAMWRMQCASRLLLDGSPVAAVAAAVGYESEPAFSRAFKKRVGQAPATWRRLASHRP